VSGPREARPTPALAAVAGAPAGRSLAANVSWLVVATATYSACQWLIIVVLTRAASVRSVGQYANALAITAPIVLLAGLQLRDVQATDVRREYSFGDYLGLRLVALVGALLAIAVAALVSAPDPEGLWTVGLIGLAKVFESLSDLQYGLLQQHERMDRIAQSLLVRSLLGLAAITAGLALTGSVAVGAGALALTWAAAALLLDRRFVRALPHMDAAGARPRFERKRLLSLARKTAPLGVVIMLVSLQTNVPRYFIKQRLGTEDLGVFAAMASLFIAGGLFVNAVGQSASPRLARAFAARDWRQFGRALAWMVGGALTLGLGGAGVAALFGRPLLAMFFGAAYAEHSGIFTTLMFVSGLAYSCSVLGYAMTAARCFSAQPPLFTAVVLCEIAACAVLVPRLGLTGAALAWGLALAVQCLGAAGILARAVRRHRDAAARVAPRSAEAPSATS
jgi:O-antigen/teichoic acid export membrane protein